MSLINKYTLLSLPLPVAGALAFGPAGLIVGVGAAFVIGVIFKNA